MQPQLNQEHEELNNPAARKDQKKPPKTEAAGRPTNRNTKKPKAQETRNPAKAKSKAELEDRARNTLEEKLKTKTGWTKLELNMLSRLSQGPT